MRKILGFSLCAFLWAVATANVFEQLHTDTLPHVLLILFFFFGGGIWLFIALKTL